MQCVDIAISWNASYLISFLDDSCCEPCNLQSVSWTPSAITLKRVQQSFLMNQAPIVVGHILTVQSSKWLTNTMLCTLCIAQLQYRWVRGRRGTIQDSFLAPELVFKCKREKMRKILNVFLSLAWQAVSKYGLNYQGCSPALLMSRAFLDPVVQCWAQAVQSSILCSSRVHLGLVGVRDSLGETRREDKMRWC